MKKEVNQNRLNGKDLMNVGIFTAINVILGVVVAVAIGLTPIGTLCCSDHNGHSNDALLYENKKVRHDSDF